MRHVFTWFAAMLMAATPLSAEVYKTIDENGNVVYTDRPPSEDAKPMELPGLSVIKMIKSSGPDPAPGAGSGEAEVPFRELRRMYRDFSIVSPEPDETFWGTSNTATVTWAAPSALRPGMAVTVYVDGQARDPSTAQSITLTGLDRGAHTVYAQLKDASRRNVATTEAVTFYIQQYSSNFGGDRNPGN